VCQCVRHADCPCSGTGVSIVRFLCLQGHYVPAFAAHIYHTNKYKDPSKVINLKGIAIGNGLTDPGACFRDRSQGMPRHAIDLFWM
jgi:Serine carboxypeptidase